MFFTSQGFFGSNVFLRAYEALPIPAEKRLAAVARWLDVSPSTVKGWITGRHCPPRATVYAIWLESTEGRGHIHTDLFNEARMFATKAAVLDRTQQTMQEAINALRSELAQVKANSQGIRHAVNDGVFSDTPPLYGKNSGRKSIKPLHWGH